VQQDVRRLSDVAATIRKDETDGAPQEGRRHLGLDLPRQALRPDLDQRPSAGCAGRSTPRRAATPARWIPLATGILPIALGEATKTVPFLMDADKAYRFTIAWGRDTTTLDREGETTGTSDVRPTREEVEAALPAFIGEVDQIPPNYSAIKVDGERAYDLAREGVEFELKTRKVNIHALRVWRRPDADHVDAGDGMRQGHLCPRRRPRPGQGARGLRPRRSSFAARGSAGSPRLIRRYRWKLLRI
jgi:hypothetical protein